MYRSDLNYLRGAAWIATGALQIEGSKRATDLISDVRHPPFLFIIVFMLVPTCSWYPVPRVPCSQVISTICNHEHFLCVDIVVFWIFNVDFLDNKKQNTVLIYL